MNDRQVPPARATTSLGRRTARRGVAVAGAPVGILCIQGMAALWPGNIQNATTFDFPVRYGVVNDITFPQIACGDDAATAPIVAAAQALVANGARAVVGACGSFGHYQRAVADAVPVPVYMSILTQLPFVLQSLGKDRRLLVVFADPAAFTARIREQCGIPEDPRIVPLGLTQHPELWTMAEPDTELDFGKLADTFADEIARHMDERVAAILLQCSDLPPFAAHLQRRFGVPIFDMAGLIAWLHHALVRREFNGYL